MNNRDLARFVALMEKRRKHEDAIEDVKAQIAALEEKIITNMQQAGIARVAINGRTVWLDRKVWAGASDGTAALAAALKEAGLEDLVKEAVNAQTLSGWVREFDPDHTLGPEQIVALLPAAVQPVIRVSEVFKLGMRKA